MCGEDVCADAQEDEWARVHAAAQQSQPFGGQAGRRPGAAHLSAQLVAYLLFVQQQRVRRLHRLQRACMHACMREGGCRHLRSCARWLARGPAVQQTRDACMHLLLGRLTKPLPMSLGIQPAML